MQARSKDLAIFYSAPQLRGKLVDVDVFKSGPVHDPGHFAVMVVSSGCVG